MTTHLQLIGRSFRRLIERPDIFISICQLVLVLTGSAKLLSLLFFPDLQTGKDTVFPGMTGRDVLFWAALCELGVAAALSKLKLLPQLLILYWLGLGIGYYRFTNSFLGGRPCSCLGKLSELSGLWQSVTNTLLTGFLLFMLCGSAFYVVRMVLMKTQKANAYGPASELLYDT